jgi:hypothetical protein
MKYIFSLFAGLLFTLNFTQAQKFDSKYVQVSNSQVGNYTIGMMKLSRKDNHVKVKYFAANENGVSVGNRYKQWAQGKNIVLYSSGTYFGDDGNPVGLCIDNGNVVNNLVKTTGFDALAIVYATGGIAVSDLKQGNLNIVVNNTPTTVNVRNPLDAQKFKTWAISNSATVFQTHLLCYNNDLKVYPPNGGSSSKEASRRFLAVCQDKQGAIQHVILNIKELVTVYEGSKAINEYLLHPSSVFNKIFFMINLDTGSQDVFESYDGNGNRDTRKYFGGTTPISGAKNLLVYYYE